LQEPAAMKGGEKEKKPCGEKTRAGGRTGFIKNIPGKRQPHEGRQPQWKKGKKKKTKVPRGGMGLRGVSTRLLQRDKTV